MILIKAFIMILKNTKFIKNRITSFSAFVFMVLIFSSPAMGLTIDKNLYCTQSNNQTGNNVKCVCFSVNSAGDVAVGYDDYTINIYNNKGQFLYNYAFNANRGDYAFFYDIKTNNLNIIFKGASRKDVYNIKDKTLYIISENFDETGSITRSLKSVKTINVFNNIYSRTENSVNITDSAGKSISVWQRSEISITKNIVEIIIFIAIFLSIIIFVLTNVLKKFHNNQLLQTSNVSANKAINQHDYPDGAIYFGNLINGKRNGSGKLICSNKSCFEGNFIDDKINGYGRGIYYDEKQNYVGVYVGEYKSGLRNGQGVFKDVNGYIENGTWEDDKFIR